jgi:hypothetical protein
VELVDAYQFRSNRDYAFVRATPTRPAPSTTAKEFFMAEKLAEATWTGFTKKQKLDLDDAALVKALARFEKTDESKPEPRLAALEDIIDEVKKQVTALTKRKKELGDKPFNEAKDKLYALLDVAETTQKSARAAAAEADVDEEEDSPALLTTKMVPLLRELRKGEARMSALVCTAGKNTAVLIMRRAISPARRKIMAEFVDAKGGAKFIAGECLWENNALTFVVQSKAGGLARRLKQALLDQTEMRVKVRVRGEDGEEEEEGEGDEGQAGGQDAPKPPSPEALSYTQRLRKVRPALEQALEARHPESTKLRAVMGFASEKAAAEDFAGATKALEMIEKLLGATGSRAAEAMEHWKAQRAAAVTSLKTVAARIASAKHASSAKAILEIQAVMKNLTAEPSSPQQVTELQNYLGSDDVVHDVCELAEDIRTPLLAALSELRAAMA